MPAKLTCIYWGCCETAATSTLWLFCLTECASKALWTGLVLTPPLDGTVLACTCPMEDRVVHNGTELKSDHFQSSFLFFLVFLPLLYIQKTYPGKMFIKQDLKSYTIPKALLLPSISQSFFSNYLFRVSTCYQDILLCSLSWTKRISLFHAA